MNSQYIEQEQKPGATFPRCSANYSTHSNEQLGACVVDSASLSTCHTHPVLAWLTFQAFKLMPDRTDLVAGVVSYPSEVKHEQEHEHERQTAKAEKWLGSDQPALKPTIAKLQQYLNTTMHSTTTLSCSILNLESLVDSLSLALLSSSAQLGHLDSLPPIAMIFYLTERQLMAVKEKWHDLPEPCFRQWSGATSCRKTQCGPNSYRAQNPISSLLGGAPNNVARKPVLKVPQ